MKSEVTRSESGLKLDAFFADVYGARWEVLKAALCSGVAEKFVMKNPFGLQDYALDEASLLPVRLLNVSGGGGGKIADLCASPGGKTLAMIFELKGEAEWFCNDLSLARVQRLKAVLHDCLPGEVLARVRVSKSDGARWGLQFPAAFDRVLVDAPCSGERHLLASPRELARWSLKGSRRLTVRQHALLCAAVDAVKPGGRIVYSTCSISPLENDGVIEKILKSREGRVRVVGGAVSDFSEPTRFGQIVLPDRAAGRGPIYACALEKLS